MKKRALAKLSNNFLFLFLITLIGCNAGTTVSVGWEPPFIPVRVDLNNRGNVNISASRGVARTPVGNFYVGFNQPISKIREIQQSYPHLTLIVVVDGQATVFKIEPDINFEVEFNETSIYKITTLKKENNNIILIIDTVRSSLDPTASAPTRRPSTVVASTPTSQSQAAANIQCAGAAATRLNIGMRARVTYTDGTPNSIRNAPASSTVLGRSPEGTGMTIIGGPRCNNRLIWWHVETDNNLRGWTAEGRPGNYWLEPIR